MSAAVDARRRWVYGAAIAVTAVVSVAPAPTPAAASSPPAVDDFTGTVEEFYVVPDPLPPGEPGDVIRTQAIDAPPGEVGLRIMYHSTDANGTDRAVTGVLYHPEGEAPDGGWPVVATAHGTTGIAEQCAPSRWPYDPATFGVRGVRVATDYVGLGPVGEVHPYLSADAEGNAVVDSVIAAHEIPTAAAGDEWLVVGHSQGGHAALAAADRAAERAPDLPLLGTVAIAPGAQLAESYGDEVQTRIITTLVLFGAAADDPSIDPEDYLSPEAYRTASIVVEAGCLGDAIAALLPLAVSEDYFLVDPRTDDALGEEWLVANEPTPEAVDVPLLLIQGDADITVVPARTDALFQRLCGIGQVVEYMMLPGADHDTEPVVAADDIASWLAARLAGDPASSTCP